MTNEERLYRMLERFVILACGSPGPDAWDAVIEEAEQLLAATAEELAKGVVWQDRFRLDDMGYLNILARTGPVLDEPDERGIWFENNVMPNAWVELIVTVTKEE